MKKAQIASIRKLAKHVGRSHTAVCRWVSHPDWPFGAGPWSTSMVTKMKAWANETLMPDYSREPYIGNSKRREKPPAPRTPLDDEIEREIADLVDGS